jgi:hypothetical protein
MLSPASPTELLRFSSESTPTMKSTDMVLVRQPSITAKAVAIVRA